MSRTYILLLSQRRPSESMDHWGSRGELRCLEIAGSSQSVDLMPEWSFRRSKTRGCSEDWSLEVSSSKRQCQLLVSKSRSQVQQINTGMVVAPLFRIDVPLSS
jgi:hypothetical protein